MKRLLTLCLLVPCGLSFAQYRSDAEVAKSFMQIFQRADTAALLEMMPPVSVYRMTSPEETQGKTDEEVIEMSKQLRDEMVLGFRCLLHEADSLRLDRSKIKMIGHEVTPIVNYPGFSGLSVYFTYGKKKGEFSLGTALINEIWYVYAIDQMLGVFTEMVPIKK